MTMTEAEGGAGLPDLPATADEMSVSEAEVSTSSDQPSSLSESATEDSGPATLPRRRGQRQQVTPPDSWQGPSSGRA